MAPGAWKWSAGVVRAGRHGPGLLSCTSGLEVTAVAGVLTAAALWRCCGLRSAGVWGTAG